jgi:hypothetical protein
VRFARIVVSITFYYRDTRLCFLAEVLRSLSEFPAAAMDVLVLTNTCHKEQLASLRRLCDESLSGNICQIRSYGDLQNPLHLAWSHKAIIAAEFVGGTQHQYTHFIYLEDDVRLSIANFSYFVDFRERLRGFGLLPAFVRIEYSTALGGFVGSDVFWRVYVPAQSYLRLGQTVMVNLPNPYNPCFILDAELAREYVRSPSFDREGSQAVCPWGLTERAAMGLCLENVPRPFQSRYVVPVSMQTGMVPAFASISHLPNNYADNPRSPLAKVRIDELFAGTDELSDPARWDTGDPGQPRWSTTLCKRLGVGEAAARDGIRTGRAESAAPIIAAAPSGNEREPPTRPEQYYLVSDHDTVLYLEAHSHRLRHAPFGIATPNLVLELTGSLGRLVARGESPSEVGQVSFASSDGQMVVALSRTDLDCRIENFPDGRIGIRAGETYLGADPDGVARNNRSWCRDWERYRLIRADTVKGLALLRCYSWVSHDDRRIVSLADQPLDFGRERPTEYSALAATLAQGAIEARRDLVIGPARVRIVGKDRSIFFETCDRDESHPPAHLEIANPSGPDYRFSRFMPLVHYCVEGDDFNYRCLHLSLCSLEKYGRFRGAICVVCDRPTEELIKYIPQLFHRQLIVLPQRGPEPPGERDREGAPIDYYQPVMRCSADLIFGSAIVDLLIDLLVQGKRDCTAEDLAYSPLTDSAPRHTGIIQFRPVFGEQTSAARMWIMRGYLDELGRRSSM